MESAQGDGERAAARSIDARRSTSLHRTSSVFRPMDWMGTMTTSRARLTLVGMLLSLSSAFLACNNDGGGTTAPPYTGDPGPYRVGHATWMATDAARADRLVAVSVWYPADSAADSATLPPATYPFAPFDLARGSSSSSDWEALGYDRAFERPATSPDRPFPLVVLSPGWSVPGWMYGSLATRLATYGYVTAVIDHSGDGDLFGSMAALSLQSTMFHRARDISFAITDLLARNDAAGDLLQGAIDPSKVAVGGHSIGGYAGYALAGGDDLVCDSRWAIDIDGGTTLATCVPTPRDIRVRALISLDGSSPALRYAELARIPIPTLLMGPPPAYRVAPYETFLARPHAAIQRLDAYRVDIERIEHISFASFCQGVLIGADHGLWSRTAATAARSDWSCDTSLPPGDMHQVLTRYVVAFLEVHFRNSTSAAATLTASDAATRTPRVQFIDSETCSVTVPDDSYFAYRTAQVRGACAVARKDPAEFFAPP
jgi:predicted dienelactone hydrolase